MIFERVHLHNIRSHTDSVIDFPTGTVLLSGDIGSGKSSVLQAIEFALFGIRRGEVAGEGLLRHGEKDGFVELTLQLDNTSVVVNRTLKRVKDAVRQDGGFLVINGEKEELTAREIKARVLELLDYPQELVTKTKGFVFRYTVYTPQEEMKHIVSERASDRLDVLRSVFDVEKYRIISENASTLAKALRDKKRFLQGRVDDLPELESQQESLSKEIAAHKQTITELSKQRAEKKQVLVDAKKQLKEFEEAHTREQKRKEKRSSLTSKQESLQSQLRDVNNRLERIQKKASQTLTPVVNPEEKIEKVQQLKEKNQSAKTTSTAAKQSLQKQIDKLHKQSSDVSKLTTCPTCQQDVSDAHKDEVDEHIKQEVNSLEQKISQHDARIQKASNNLLRIQKKLQSLKQQQQAYQEFVVKQKRMQDAAEQLKEVTNQKQELSTQLTDVNKELDELDDSSFDQEAYLQAKQQVDAAQQVVHKLEVQVKQEQARLESTNKQLTQTQQKIDSLQTQKQQASNFSQAESVVSSVFSQAVSEIERRVLSSIHQEFSAKFTEWFMLLLEDDSLFAQLDESFAPVLTQDGYDVSFASLSGGEKQSVALAYRLALNNVVSALQAGVHATDVLVLDEPTDGFSQQQLDRVRDVLARLEAKQVLLVSHEQKLYSYVDEVLEVVKRQGVSTVSRL